MASTTVAAPGRDRRDRRPAAAARRPRPTPTGGDTSPAGIGLPGLCPASRGASTMSLSAPIDDWSAVIATPSRSAVSGSRAGEDGDRADDEPVEDRRERMGQPDEAADARRREAAPPGRDPSAARQT